MDRLRKALTEACNEMDKFAFAFSGGTSEDDLVVAKHGIEYMKSLLAI